MYIDFEKNVSNDKIGNEKNNVNSSEKNNNLIEKNLTSFENERNNIYTKEPLQQDILKVSSDSIVEYPDVGPIKFKPIFDRLMISATTLDLNDQFE